MPNNSNTSHEIRCASSTWAAACYRRALSPPRRSSMACAPRSSTRAYSACEGRLGRPVNKQNTFHTARMPSALQYWSVTVLKPQSGTRPAHAQARPSRQVPPSPAHLHERCQGIVLCRVVIQRRRRLALHLGLQRVGGRGGGLLNAAARQAGWRAGRAQAGRQGGGGADKGRCQQHWSASADRGRPAAWSPPAGWLPAGCPAASGRAPRRAGTLSTCACTTANSKQRMRRVECGEARAGPRYMSGSLGAALPDWRSSLPTASPPGKSTSGARPHLRHTFPRLLCRRSISSGFIAFRISGKCREGGGRQVSRGCCHTAGTGKAAPGGASVCGTQLRCCSDVRRMNGYSASPVWQPTHTHAHWAGSTRWQPAMVGPHLECGPCPSALCGQSTRARPAGCARPSPRRPGWSRGCSCRAGGGGRAAEQWVWGGWRDGARPPGPLQGRRRRGGVLLPGWCLLPAALALLSFASSMLAARWRRSPVQHGVLVTCRPAVPHHGKTENGGGQELGVRQALPCKDSRAWTGRRHGVVGCARRSRGQWGWVQRGEAAPTEWRKSRRGALRAQPAC